MRWTRCRWRSRVALAVALALSLSSGSSLLVGRPAGGQETASNAASVTAALDCAALPSARDFGTIPEAPTRIISAVLIPADQDAPEHCLVVGYVAPQIQFHLHLPTGTWNGRYLQSGCGGFCGAANSSPTCVLALGRNFAIAYSNLGHYGADPGDALWAANDLQLRVDWAYRANHALLLAARAIMAVYYGQGPAYTYFDGCSDGGREALTEAQQFPEDFDGIVAGAPAAIMASLAYHLLTWNARANLDAAGNQLLTPEKLPMLHDAVLAACDGLDGVTDRLVADPLACQFDPATLQCPGDADGPECLTTAQIEAVVALYSGPVDSAGRHLYPGGLQTGSELAWPSWVVEQEGQPTKARLVGNGYVQYMSQPLPQSTATTYLDVQYDLAEFESIQVMGQLYNAVQADLSAFRDRGGKLILWHGLADPAIPPTGTLAYYGALRQQMGGLEATQQFARLFLFPGMYHCDSGDGPNEFDMLSAITAWVEQGTAPRVIVASEKDDDGAVVRTRPSFAYPLRTQYTGSGSIDDAASFTAVMPAILPNDDYDWVGRDLFGGRTPFVVGGGPEGSTGGPGL